MLIQLCFGGNKVDESGVCGPKKQNNELKEAKTLLRAKCNCRSIVDVQQLILALLKGTHCSFQVHTLICGF